MRKQPNIFAARITLGTATICPKPSYAHFDIPVHISISTVYFAPVCGPYLLIFDVLTQKTLK